MWDGAVAWQGRSDSGAFVGAVRQGWARAAGEVRCVQVVYVWNVNLSLFRAECPCRDCEGPRDVCISGLCSHA